MPYTLTLGLQNEELLDPAVAGELEQIITALQTQFVAQLGDIADPPRARVFLGAVQSIPDSVETFLAFVPARTNGIEEYDPLMMYELGSKAVVISTPGLYVLTAMVIFTASAVGSRTLTFAQVNGIIEANIRQPGSAVNNYLLHTVPLQITQAQVDTGPVKFGVRVFQSSGGPLDVSTSSWFSIHRVAKL